MKRSVEMFSPAKKTILCILAALLLTALAYAVVSPKAYATELIDTVYVNYDASKVKLDASMTGREANDIFKQNRSVGDQSKDKCKLDYMYSFLARLEPGSEHPTGYGSYGQILRYRLAENDDLLSADRKYFLVFNLIQKEGYEFPHNSNKDAKLAVKVYVNGKLRTDAQVDRYNTDSVDVYVPIECSTDVVVKSMSIDPAEAYMKNGSSRELTALVVGTQGLDLKWTMAGNKSSSSSITPKSNGKCEVYVAPSESKGTVITIR